jgi:hypothetical protein
VDLTSWGHLGGFKQLTLVLMVDLTMCPFPLNHVVDLTSWDHHGGFNLVILVLMLDLTMCPFKVFQSLKKIVLKMIG